MPKRIQVSSLQTFCLKCLSQIMKRLCENDEIHVDDLEPAVTYFKTLPNILRSSIYDLYISDCEKVFKNDTFDLKQLFMTISLKTEELYMNEFVLTLPYISNYVIFEGHHLKKLSFDDDGFCNPEVGDSVQRAKFALYRPLYTFMKSLSNLTTFHSIIMCDNNMFEIFSQYCPFLEEIYVASSVDLGDEGVCSLCGYESPAEAYAMLYRTGNFISRKTVCRNIKSITLKNTQVSKFSVAVLLQTFPNLQFLNVNPDINVADVFTVLYGFDSNTYDTVTKKYALTTLWSSLEVNVNIVSLIIQTCPCLEHITLCCNGVQQMDKNLLANLLNLPIKNLSLTNCNMEVLLWYLKERGSNLEQLSIKHLIPAPLTGFLNRNHLQCIIKYCPNLENFSLRMYDGNVSISPNVPYSSFGNDLVYFTSLITLTIEGFNLQPDDLKIFVQKCTNLQEVQLMCKSLKISDDNLLDELLSEGAFKNLSTLYVPDPFLTMADLRQILNECPKLHTVGPLSVWAISKRERGQLEHEIKENNWDLEINKPEMFFRCYW